MYFKYVSKSLYGILDSERIASGKHRKAKPHVRKAAHVFLAFLKG
jgi:hypothetical protein